MIKNIIRKFFLWYNRKNNKYFNNYLIPNSMSLQQYIEEVLISIPSGIKAAQKKHADDTISHGALICPDNKISTSQKDPNHLHEIEFDLATTIGNTFCTQGKAEAGIRVIGTYNASLKNSHQFTESVSNISRIKFKVPLRYPLTRLRDKKDHYLNNSQN